MQLTIKTKLLLVLLSLSLAFAAASVAGWIGLVENHNAFQTVYKDRVACLKQLKDVSDAYAIEIESVAHLARDGRLDAATAMQRLDGASDIIWSQWHAYRATYLTEREAQLAADAQERMATADNAVARLRVLIAAADTVGLARFASEDLHPAIDPVIAALDRLVDLQLKVATDEFAGADRAFIETGRIELLLGLVGLAVVALGAWLTLGGVARPLAAMLDTLRRIAAKDFSVAVPDVTRSDEIGEMARAIEIFRQAGLTNERLQAENQGQRAWLERVLDELPVGVTIFDAQQRLTVRNRTMNRIHPHPDPKRLAGVSLEQLIREIVAAAPDTGTAADREGFIQEIAARYQSTSEGQFEAVFPGGVVVDVHFRWIEQQHLVMVHNDISGLRSAERRAMQAEQKIRGIVESLPVGLIFYDEHERVILRNKRSSSEIPAPTAAMGESRQEPLLRESPPDEVATADGRVAHGEEAVDLMMAVYRSQTEGAMAVRRGGQHFTVNFRNLPGIGRIVMVTNVTDLAEARQVAQESERRLRTAIAEIPISFSLFSQDGTLILLNEGFRREFRDVEEVIRPGATIRDIVAAYLDTSRAPPPRFGSDEDWRRSKQDPTRREAVLDKLTDSFFRGPAQAVDVQRDYGTYRLRRVTLPNGEMVRVSADITDLREKEAEIRRLGESALAQRTAILQEVIDTIPQAIAVTSPDRQIRFTNRSLAKLTGERGDAPPRRLSDILSAIGIPPQSVDELTTGDPQEIEVTSNDQRPLRIRATTVPTGDILVTISDLSEQRQAEADRLEQQQRVLQAEKSQAVLTLAGTIAHDFNNLLAVILGFSSIAADATAKVLKAATLDATNAQELADAKSSVEKVITSAERGRNVVASLNALTHERKVGVERLDLRTTVRDVEELLRVLVPASIRLDLNLAKLPCPVLANATQIEQIVTNLCVNAVHALGGKAGLVSVSVDRIDVDGGRADGLRATSAAVHRGGSHVEVADDGSVSMFAGVLSMGRHVRLRVVDNGHGMTEDVARKIFTPFFTTKPPGVGTGLGLSSVIEIVAAHSGGIHVRTRPQVGTTFMVLLPFADTRVAAPEPIQAADRAEPFLATGGIRTDARVLVIDDESLLAELAANVLRKAGYEVEAFTDPTAALSRVKRDPEGFDLIITDQTMPGMTGLELIEQVRPLTPDVPIIICTGYAPEVEKGGAASLGINKVLRKPYSPQDLAKLVREALAEPFPSRGARAG